VAVGADGRQRVVLAADYHRLDFVRVVRATSLAPIDGPVELIGPVLAADPAAVTPGAGE
jgi:rod shape-determining protein MreC